MSVSNEEADIPKSIQQLCRLCLGDESLEDIFKQEEDLHEWILDFLSITVCVDDKLSKSICFCCRTRLHEFRSFQQQCLEVQDVLKGEITSILDENALKLIVTDAAHADVTNGEGVSADWDEVSEIKEEALCEELYGHETVQDLPEKTTEWQGEATGVPVVIDETEDFHTEAVSGLGVGLVSGMQVEEAINQPMEDSMNNTAISSKAKQESNPSQSTYCGKISETQMKIYSLRRIYIKKRFCPFCDKSFNRLSLFNKHVIKHKKEQTKITAIPDEKIQVNNPDEETEVVKQVDEIKVEVINLDEETEEELEKGDVVSVEPMQVESETTPISNDVVESIKVEELIIEDVDIDEDTSPQSSLIGDESFAPVEEEVGRKSLADQNTRESELLCGQCNRQFLSKKQYQIHTFYVHEPFICSVCNKGFVSLGRLAIHRKFHKSKVVIDKTKSELATCGQIARSRGLLEKFEATTQMELAKVFNANEQSNNSDLEQTTDEQKVIGQSAIEELQAPIPSVNVKVFNPKLGPAKFKLRLKSLESNRYLRSRAKILHGSKKYKCSICRKKFNTTRRMCAHMLIHTRKNKRLLRPIEKKFDLSIHGPRIYLCPICRKTFIRLRQMADHMKAHRNSEDHVKRKGEKQHVEAKQVHGDLTSTNSQCPKETATRDQLIDHRIADQSAQKNTSPVDEIPTLSHRGVEMQLVAQTLPQAIDTSRTEASKFTCPLIRCGLKCKTINDLKQHLETHEPYCGKLFVCSLCECRVLSKSKMDEHMEWHRRKEELGRTTQQKRNNECQEDEVICLEDDDDDIIEQPVVGEKVEKTNSNLSITKPIIRAVRYGTVQDADGRLKRGCEAIQKETCTICAKEIQASLMEGHLNRHAGVRPYKCERGCVDLNFYCQLLLTTHYTRVHGNTPTECDICHKVYPSKLRMKSHQKEVHQKIHVCMNCPQIFDSSASLLRHIETANHAKRYPCKKCNASFDRQHQLTKHIRTKRHYDIDQSSTVQMEDSIEVEEVKVETQDEEIVDVS